MPTFRHTTPQDLPEENQQFRRWTALPPPPKRPPKRPPAPDTRGIRSCHDVGLLNPRPTVREARWTIEGDGT
jgi:hypothetical protein